jgi:glycerol uptake facilitator-like aquaporin
MHESTLPVHRAAAECVGTALLLTAVVGSGIMADRLAAGSIGLALLANSLATGGALVALILAFGPISGAHLNPVVTLAAAAQGGLPWREVPIYVLAQVLGALAGVALAHGMFGLPIFSLSGHARAGSAQVLSEAVATFGLLSVVWGCAKSRPGTVAIAVAAYITGAYWFTSSTSFANPAVTLARAASNTFTGIRPLDVPGFIFGQLVGAGLATALFRWLVPRRVLGAANMTPLPHALPVADYPAEIQSGC